MAEHLFAVVVELKLKKPIDETPDFELAIQGFFKNVREHIPGCLYAPSEGCLQVGEADVLFHVTVLDNETSYKDFMKNMHSDIARPFGSYVVDGGHASATFEVDNPELISVIRDHHRREERIPDSYASKLFKMGHHQLEK